MPLAHGTSNKTRQRNIEEMIASGHAPMQSVAAAYRQQRSDRAKGHGRHKMPESSSHAPGNEIGRGEGGVRQRFRMGEGGSPMGGNFGIEPLHEANRSGGQNHGSHVEHDGLHLHDRRRAGPPAIDMGEGMMAATAHSHHGPHHHGSEHDHTPKGTRSHHIGGAHVHGKNRK